MIITVFVTAGTSNAVNLTDGMDGLAAGCVALCSFVFVALTSIIGDVEEATRLLLPAVPAADELGVMCGAMMGACLGFLWYNCHPAQMFMGDTGSLPLGGLIGYVAIVTRQELMLLIVGGIFVIEALRSSFRWAISSSREASASFSSRRSTPLPPERLDRNANGDAVLADFGAVRRVRAGDGEAAITRGAGASAPRPLAWKGLHHGKRISGPGWHVERNRPHAGAAALPDRGRIDAAILIGIASSLLMIAC